MSGDVRHVFFVAFVRPLRCRSLFDAFPHVVQTLANRKRRLYSFCFSAGMRLAEKLDWKGLRHSIHFKSNSHDTQIFLVEDDNAYKVLIKQLT